MDQFAASALTQRVMCGDRIFRQFQAWVAFFHAIRLMIPAVPNARLPSLACRPFRQVGTEQHRWGARYMGLAK